MAAPCVLIVDDDPDLRETMTDAIELGGYHAESAVDGLDALRMLQQGLRPDLILLDMMMPEMDGRAFRKEQLETPELAAIPTVIFTAYGPPSVLAEELKATGFLAKPLHLSSLLDLVARITSTPREAPAHIGE